uniref:Uncharacterized protein n=1 Tax=Oryza sativa subsp. japonica TaxID=39947 RepID=Q6ZAA7_ORYSJ|nr:hypothetical protein [Oryza sativa Japonica Group]BAD09815.1 hypothetical protein [Oryza sativa Japonica Group]
MEAARVEGVRGEGREERCEGGMGLPVVVVVRTEAGEVGGDVCGGDVVMVAGVGQEETMKGGMDFYSPSSVLIMHILVSFHSEGSKQDSTARAENLHDHCSYNCISKREASADENCACRTSQAAAAATRTGVLRCVGVAHDHVAVVVVLVALLSSGAFSRGLCSTADPLDPHARW